MITTPHVYNKIFASTDLTDFILKSSLEEDRTNIYAFINVAGILEENHIAARKEKARDSGKTGMKK